MGCDIHTFVEVKRDGQWQLVSPQPRVFDCRNYGLFGWLANVRNYSAVPPLSAPRGLPVDVSAHVREESELDDGHTRSWLSAKELLDFDLDATFEDRRVTRQTGPNSFNGGCTADPGGGEVVVYREFFGSCLTDTLEVLRGLGAPEDVRVVFWFDN